MLGFHSISEAPISALADGGVVVAVDLAAAGSATASFTSSSDNRVVLSAAGAATVALTSRVEARTVLSAAGSTTPTLTGRTATRAAFAIVGESDASFAPSSGARFDIVGQATMDMASRVEARSPLSASGSATSDLQSRVDARVEVRAAFEIAGQGAVNFRALVPGFDAASVEIYVTQPRHEALIQVIEPDLTAQTFEGVMFVQTRPQEHTVLRRLDELAVAA